MGADILQVTGVNSMCAASAVKAKSCEAHIRCGSFDEYAEEFSFIGSCVSDKCFFLG